MNDRKQLFVRALKHFDFDRHRAHRWLLLKRSEREPLLAEAGLLEWVGWDTEPVHIGNIERVEQNYSWGQVVFSPVAKGLDLKLPCSVYAGFEYLIRKCAMFPSFISLADLIDVARKGSDVLPVYGSPVDLSEQQRELRPATISRMLELHGIHRHSELLAEQSFEISDDVLFEKLFGDYTQRVEQEQANASADDDDEATGLDDIDVWHT